jgi:hypothetical protein
MRRAWAIVVVPLALAACGEQAKTSRLDLTTPGVHTGAPLPEATETPTPTPAPKATAKVTSAEKRVIKGWSDSLRRGDVERASAYFDIPSAVSNNAPTEVLESIADVRAFNATLPCGAKLLRTRRGAEGFVVGVFKLTERKGAPAPCGTGVGAEAAVAFEIEKGHIKTWVRVEDPTAGQDPMATPTPTATADGNIT